jgi:hypothetical protein
VRALTRGDAITRAVAAGTTGDGATRRSQKERMRSATASGCSQGSRCAAPGTTSNSPFGQCGRFRVRWASGPRSPSAAPASTSAGAGFGAMVVDQSSRLPRSSQSVQACGSARWTSCTAMACDSGGSVASVFAATKVSASSGPIAPSAAQPIISARRSSAIGSGESGDAASSTTARSPKSPFEPSIVRPATTEATFPPMEWPISPHSVAPLLPTARSTSCAISSTVVPLAAELDPKPGRSMPTRSTVPARRERRRANSSELDPRAWRQNTVAGMSPSYRDDTCRPQSACTPGTAWWSERVAHRTSRFRHAVLPPGYKSGRPRSFSGRCLCSTIRAVTKFESCPSHR